MEEKKVILVMDGYDDSPICVASNTSAARMFAAEILMFAYLAKTLM